MRVSKMNVHQLAMYKIMDELTKDIIGGYENSMDDFCEGDEEYEEAKAFLTMGHEAMANFFYREVMGHCKSGSIREHARFAGGDFLRERIEKRLVKWGY